MKVKFDSMIESKLNELIRSCKKWIRVYNGHSNKEKYIKDFDVYSSLIEICERGLRQRKVEKGIQSFSNLSSELIDESAIEALTTKIQETIPDFIPVIKEIIKGCTVTAMNYGYLELDDRSILEGSTQFFALNNDPIEYLSVPKNCKGKITLYSSWLYKQEVREQLKVQGWPSTIETATKSFKIEHHFYVNEAGHIQVFKGTVMTTNAIIRNPGDILFNVKDLEVSVDSNAVFSFTGGIETNEYSPIPSLIKNYLGQKLKGKKELLMSFSTALVLAKETPPKITPKLKELIFEKEDQAILSSDQLHVLQKWWDELNPKLKNAIENRDAIILVEGYTSDTGTEMYNFNLGLDRAKHIRDMLKGIIGIIDDKSVAKIKIKSIGEYKESRRYVKITILNTY